MERAQQGEELVFSDCDGDTVQGVHIRGPAKDLGNLMRLDGLVLPLWCHAVPRALRDAYQTLDSDGRTWQAAFVRLRRSQRAGRRDISRRAAAKIDAALYISFSVNMFT